MRILIISNYFPPFEIGGWEQLTADVAAMLEERGHAVWVLTGNYRAGEITAEASTIERLLHLESPDHIHYHPQYTLLSRRWEHQNRRLLAHRTATFSPDIIFINGMWNLPRSLAKEAERLCPGRVVYYMASPWPAELNAHTTYWNLPAVHPSLQWPRKVLGNLLQRWWLPNTPNDTLAFEHVLCVSDYMRRFIVEQTGVSLENARVVYNGIDPAEFSPPAQSQNGRKAKLRLLYAGQLREDKGVHTAIEAVSHAVEANPHLALSFTIVGGGSPAYIGGLEERIRALKLADIVTLAGQIPREKIPAMMASHDVLLFPSIWPEPLARVVQEAMAAGLVVIGTTTGGTPELLTDGRNGLTFEAENAAMLGEQIGRLAGDSDLYGRLSQAARQTVEACFTQERMVDEIEAYFNQLLHQRNKNGG